jgi:hypothetical protein
VYGDAIDVVDGDCEHVIRSGSTTTTTTTPPAAKLSIAAARTTLAAELRVTTPVAGRLTAKANGASGSATAKAAGTTTVVLRFTKAAKKSLRHKRSVKLAIAVRIGSLDESLKVTLKR